MRVQLLCLCVAIAAAVEPRAVSVAAPVSRAVAGVEAATRKMLAGPRPAADAAMRRTLDQWVAASTRLTAAPPDGSLAADVLAIRDAVFQPMGDRVLRGEWNAEGWPATPPAYLLAAGRIEAHVAGATPVSVDVSRQPPGLATVVFVTAAEVEALSALVTRIGGNEHRAPGGLMEVPNQPAGKMERIIQWWNTFFPCRPGHWEGVEVESAPVFHAIEFTDAGRTRATVKVRIGYAGGTVVLEKIGGAWTMRALTDQWMM